MSQVAVFIKNKKNIGLSIVIGLVLAFLILSATAAFALSASSISVNYNLASGSNVSYNSVVSVSGKVEPAHQTTVYIKSKRRGKNRYSTLGSVNTDANGNFSFSFRAGASGQYLATWKGDADHSAANSASLNIGVKSKITLGNHQRPKYIGQKFYVSGKIVPRHPGRKISLQARTRRGKYKTFARAKINKRGTAFKIKGSLRKKGRYRLRVAFSDTDHALSGSKRYSVRIKWANPWNISAKYSHYIVVSKRKYLLYYLRKGKIVKTFRTGVGMRSYPTPSGNFRITRKAVRPTWYPPKDQAWAKNEPDAVPWPGSPLGERGLYLSTPDRIIIHGTTKPWLLDRPRRAISHGCIRLKNSWVIWLYNRVPTGTPVRIR